MWNWFVATLFLQPVWNVLFRMFMRWIGSGGDAVDRLEVERKYSLAQQNQKQLLEQIELAGFAYWCKAEMKDWFFATRDKGELIRIRREEVDKEAVHILTIKNWATTVDGGRERLERERRISPILSYTLLFANRVMQGRQPLTLKKTRELYKGSIGDRNAVVSIDETKDLGRFSGAYMEVEVMAEAQEETKQIEKSIEDFVVQIADSAVLVKESYKDLLELSRQ
jgi:predicted adenylyl cyclase CyaB